MKDKFIDFLYCLDINKDCNITLDPYYDIYIDKNGKWVALIKYEKGADKYYPKILINKTLKKHVKFSFSSNILYYNSSDLIDVKYDFCSSTFTGKWRERYKFERWGEAESIIPEVSQENTPYLIGKCTEKISCLDPDCDLRNYFYECNINFYSLRLFVSKSKCDEYFDKEATYEFILKDKDLILNNIWI